MLRTRLAVTASIVAVTLFGPTASATADDSGPDSSTGSCAYVAKVEITLDGDSEIRGFDADRGRLVQSPLATPTGCEAPSNQARSRQDDHGTKTFTSKAPYYSSTDKNSTFTAQTNFATSLPTAFSFKISPALAAVAIGPATTANATRTPPNCTYNKVPPQPVDYIFHWSCSGQATEVEYRLDGTWAFRVEIGGQTGTATINWKFDYIIYTRIG